MSATPISASVRVTLQVEVDVGDWSDKESFAGLREQAIFEAHQRLQGTIAGKGMRIVGKPASMSVVMRGDA